LRKLGNLLCPVTLEFFVHLLKDGGTIQTLKIVDG
jgi:hypothetical protein